MLEKKFSRKKFCFMKNKKFANFFSKKITIFWMIIKSIEKHFIDNALN